MRHSWTLALLCMVVRRRWTLTLLVRRWQLAGPLSAAVLFVAS
jgi:hypothetical protein